jgi:hypothetical protein
MTNSTALPSANLLLEPEPRAFLCYTWIKNGE